MHSMDVLRGFTWSWCWIFDVWLTLSNLGAFGPGCGAAAAPQALQLGCTRPNELKASKCLRVATSEHYRYFMCIPFSDHDSTQWIQSETFWKGKANFSSRKKRMTANSLWLLRTTVHAMKQSTCLTKLPRKCTEQAASGCSSWSFFC